MGRITVGLWILLLITSVDMAPIIRNIIPSSPINAMNVVAKIAASASAVASVFAGASSYVKNKGLHYKKLLRRKFRTESKFSHLAKTEQGYFCRDAILHAFALHVAGPSEIISHMFPTRNNEHSHKTLVFACLITACQVLTAKAEIVTPQSTIILNNIRAIQPNSIAFDFDDSRLQESNNQFWKMNYTGDITDIDIIRGRPIITGNTSCDILNKEDYGIKNSQTEIKYYKPEGTVFMASDVDNVANYFACFTNRKDVAYTARYLKESWPEMDHQPINMTSMYTCFKQKISTKIYCRNNSAFRLQHYESDLVATFSTGRVRLQIKDIDAHPEKVQDLITSQALEIRRIIGKCRTQRCIILPKTEEYDNSEYQKPNWQDSYQRQKRSATCYNLLLWSYCPSATSIKQAHRIVRSYAIAQQKLFNRKLQKTNTRMFHFAKTITRMSKNIADRFKEMKDRYDKAFKEVEQLFFNQQVQLTQLQFKIASQNRQQNFLSQLRMAITMARVHSIELQNTFRFRQSVLWNAMECRKGNCEKLASNLASIDLRLVELKKAHFPIKIQVSLLDKLYILYSTPAKYESTVTSLPSWPKLNIADQCEGGLCRRCLKQKAKFTQVAYNKNIQSIRTIPKIEISSFTLKPCPFTGQPSYEYLYIHGKCLNVTIDGTNVIPCGTTYNMTYTPPPSYQAKIKPMIFYRTDKPEIHVYMEEDSKMRPIALNDSNYLQQITLPDDSDTVTDTELTALASRELESSALLHWSHVLSILSLLISFFLSIGFASQLVYIRYFFKKGYRNKIKFHSTGAKNTVAIYGTPTLEHTVLKYEVFIYLNSNTKTSILMEIHEDDTEIKTQASGYVIRNGNNYISFNCSTFLLHTTTKCNCLQQGLILVQYGPNNPTVKPMYPELPIDQQATTLPPSQ